MENIAVIDIRISPDEYVKLYEGSAKDVYTVTRDGHSIRFPAKILQKFLTHSGIEGSFVIYYDESRKFSRIDRL